MQCTKRNRACCDGCAKSYGDWSTNHGIASGVAVDVGWEDRILEPLGVGGMGAVFKARHERLDRLVAIKVVRRSGDAESLARFTREMKAAGRLRHPHVVAATDAGEVDGVPFLVMEYVEGH